MDNWTSFLLAAFCTAALSYLLGSCNMAIIVSRLFRVPDIREFGSGSAGMTNMLRTYGKKLAAITFAGDFLKGSLAVFLARVIFARMGFAMDLGYLAGIFVVLGHIFPIFFGFHGGKGVATAFGAMLFLNWMVFGTLLVGLVPIVFIVRIVSAVSLTGSAIYPVLTFLVLMLQEADLLTAVLPDTASALVITLLTFYAHRENIARFRHGKENFFPVPPKNNKKEQKT